jgi:hypothetical protein
LQARIRRSLNATGKAGCSVFRGRGQISEVEEPRVDEDAFNMSVRKFLKKLGVSAQREIEFSVREQLEAGKLRGDETLEATATVVVSGLPRDVVVTGTISLT